MWCPAVDAAYRTSRGGISPTDLRQPTVKDDVDMCAPQEDTGRNGSRSGRPPVFGMVALWEVPAQLSLPGVGMLSCRVAPSRCVLLFSGWCPPVLGTVARGLPVCHWWTVCTHQAHGGVRLLPCAQTSLCMELAGGLPAAYTPFHPHPRRACSRYLGLCPPQREALRQHS